MKSSKQPLGQHWLQHTPTLDTLVANLAPQADDFILEVGPGLGYLTSKLLKSKAEILAVEYDADIYQKLIKNFPGAKRLKVINADIRTFNFDELPRGYLLATNLPYYLSGIFFRILCDTPNKPTRATILIQKEVAQRIAAQPGEKKRSILSVLVQYWYNVSLGDIVPPELFNPPPKVDSQSVILALKDTPPSKDEFERIASTAQILFAAKRKTILNNLVSYLSSLNKKTGLDTNPKNLALEILKSAGLDPTLRAEQLTQTQILTLTQHLM